MYNKFSTSSLFLISFRSDTRPLTTKVSYVLTENMRVRNKQSRRRLLRQRPHASSTRERACAVAECEREIECGREQILRVHKTRERSKQSLSLALSLVQSSILRKNCNLLFYCAILILLHIIFLPNICTLFIYFLLLYLVYIKANLFQDYFWYIFSR